MTDLIRSAPTLDELRHKRAALLQIAASYGVTNVRVFGSVARGEARPDSDIDLMVDFPPDFSLLDLAGLLNELEALLGHPVQITSAAHLRDELRPYILPDVTPL